MLSFYDEIQTKVFNLLDNNLPKDLTYHGPHHTRDVLDSAIRIAKYQKISEDELDLLKLACLFPDSGFTKAYKDHEEEGCLIAEEFLKPYNLSSSDLETIKGMIRSTKIPQSATTLLEQIICDADLDYLGRNDFWPIANTLFKEVSVYLNITDQNRWNQIQVNFLGQHHYFTEYSINFRKDKKQQNLEEVKSRII